MYVCTQNCVFGRLPIVTHTPLIQEVAQRLSFDWSESVTIGRAVADWLALRKGEHLGLLEADEAAERAAREETKDLPTRTLEMMVSVSPCNNRPYKIPNTAVVVAPTAGYM